MKDEIIRTALEGYLRHGIREITITRLIAPLRISTKTFYKHFESKETLLEECLRILYTNNLEKFSQIILGNGDPVNKLLNVFRSALQEDFGISSTFYHDLNYYYPDLQDKAISRISEKSGTLITSLVEQGISEGYFISGVHPQIAVRGIGTLYSSITRNNQYRDSRHGPDLLFDNLVETFVRGMCTDKGRRKIRNA